MEKERINTLEQKLKQLSAQNEELKKRQEMITGTNKVIKAELNSLQTERLLLSKITGSNKPLAYGLSALPPASFVSFGSSSPMDILAAHNIIHFKDNAETLQRIIDIL